MTGTRVVVWSERVPSRAPRDPHVATVDHVAGRTFTVEGLEAVFNRSTGRSKPVRRGPGAFGTDIYVAVDAESSRGREVLGDAAHGELVTLAETAVRTWLTSHTEQNRQDAVAALQALGEQ